MLEKFYEICRFIICLCGTIIMLILTIVMIVGVLK